MRLAAEDGRRAAQVPSARPLGDGRAADVDGRSAAGMPLRLQRGHPPLCGTAAEAVVLSSTAHEGFGTIALDDDDLERMPFLKNRIDLCHPAALELLPAAEREKIRIN